ncbi:MAG: hypothetical protein ACRDV4_04740, partial [Acidimicrobiales bacterium]
MELRFDNERGLHDEQGSQGREHASPRNLVRHFGASLCAVALAGAGVLVVSPGQASAKSNAKGTMISAESSPFGRVLEVGSGSFAGYSVYEFNRDKPHALACSTTYVAAVMLSCAGKETDKTADWPVVETVGKPVAGPGVDKAMLGSFYRADIHARQVTYGGRPLYLFDTGAHQFMGEEFIESALPLPPWQGIWYLVSPKKGLPVASKASVSSQTLPDGKVSLAAELFPSQGGTGVTVYTYSKDRRRHSSCTGKCALAWPPLLTSGTPTASTGVSQQDLGTITRTNGSHQVTFDGKPLYLYS